MAAQICPQVQCLYPVFDLFSISFTSKLPRPLREPPENIARVRFSTYRYSLRFTHGTSSPNGLLVITCYDNRGMFQVLGLSLHCTVSLSNNSPSASIYYLFAFVNKLSKGFTLGLIKLLISPYSLSILPFNRKEMVYR